MEVIKRHLKTGRKHPNNLFVKTLLFHNKLTVASACTRKSLHEMMTNGTSDSEREDAKRFGHVLRSLLRDRVEDRPGVADFSVGQEDDAGLTVGSTFLHAVQQGLEDLCAAVISPDRFNISLSSF